MPTNQKRFDFAQALQHLRDGRRVRPIDAPPNTWLQLNGDKTKFELHGRDEVLSNCGLQLSLIDSVWELYEPAKP